MGFVNKMLDIMGLRGEEEDDEKSVESGREMPPSRVVPMSTNAARSVTPNRPAATNGNLVNLHQTSASREAATPIAAPKAKTLTKDSGNARVILKEPKEFEEAQPIADNLLQGKAVIINIEQCDIEVAEKIIDFIGGVVYAIDGAIQKISTGTILAVPSNIDITNELNGNGLAAPSSADEPVSTEVFSWVTSYNQRGGF